VKTLIFCFRNNTSRRLRDILGKRVADELSAHAQRCLRVKSMKALRGRLTRPGGL
jgi:hypothetical protein